MPLADERSLAEQEVELFKELKALANQLGLNLGAREGDPLFVDLIVDERNRTRAGDLDARTSAWSHISERFYLWDASIQDALTVKPACAASYQLGRAIAETYWALDPAATSADDWRSWEFLLGEHRSRRLKQLVARVSAYCDPLTPMCVSASLDEWTKVAAHPAWRGA